MVVSGSEDGKVYLYDLQSRMVRQTLDGHDGDAVLAVDVHDSLELIGSGGMTKNKLVRFWAAAGDD
jgi:COMPASS component SWD3